MNQRHSGRWARRVLHGVLQQASLGVLALPLVLATWTLAQPAPLDTSMLQRQLTATALPAKIIEEAVVAASLSPLQRPEFAHARAVFAEQTDAARHPLPQTWINTAGQREPLGVVLRSGSSFSPCCGDSEQQLHDADGVAVRPARSIRATHVL